MAKSSNEKQNAFFKLLRTMGDAVRYPVLPGSEEDKWGGLESLAPTDASRT